MEAEMIITLDDSTKYILLDEVVNNDTKYFLAVDYDEEKDATGSNYKIFAEVNEDAETYVEEVDDEDLSQELMALFTVNYSEMIDDGFKEVTED